MAPSEPLSETTLPTALWLLDGAFATVGVAVLVWWMRRRNRDQQDWPERLNTLNLEHIFIPMLAFLVAGMLGMSLLTPLDGTHLPEGTADLLAGSAAQLIGGLACLWVAGLTFSSGTPGFLMGDRRIRRHVLMGALGLLAAFPVCWVLAEGTVWLLQRAAPQWDLPQHDVLAILDQADLPGWVPMMLWIGAVLIAPFAEEVFFRGICQTALRRVFGRPAPAIWAVSILFGVSHYSQPQVVLPLVILGVALGVVYERSGSLVAPITLHLLFNLKTLIYVTVVRGQT